MDASEVNIYEACDRAIRQMNRENLREFGRLKLAKWDELNVIRSVTTLYERSVKRAKKKYRDVAFEAYLLGLELCGVTGRKARKMAEETITPEWINRILTETDFVTLYRFDTETQRKAQRLIEALAGTENRIAEIDKALRLWSRQLGQYAINITDYAVTQAYDDAGVVRVQWITQKDERVCVECHALDGQIFEIDEIPPKPHWGCRCYWRAVFSKR